MHELAHQTSFHRTSDAASMRRARICSRAVGTRGNRWCSKWKNMLKVIAARNGCGRCAPAIPGRLPRKTAVMHGPDREERGQALAGRHRQQVVADAVRRRHGEGGGDDREVPQVGGDPAALGLPLRSVRRNAGGSENRPRAIPPPARPARAHGLEIVFRQAVPVVPQWFHWTACIEPSIATLKTNITQSVAGAAGPASNERRRARRAARSERTRKKQPPRG